MVTIEPTLEVAVELVAVVTTLLACTREPGKTLTIPALPLIGERMESKESCTSAERAAACADLALASDVSKPAFEIKFFSTNSLARKYCF
jgi:hypothetical protein